MWIDDQEDILDLSKIFLERESDSINVETTTKPEEVIESFENCELDAIISDYDMPEMNGVELLEEVREKDEDFPFMLYTGKGTEEIAQEAINAGVTDYFQKQPGTEHYGFIANRVEDAVTSYREEERSEIFRSLIDITDRPVVVTNTEAEIVYVNSALEKVSGYSGEELVGNTPEMLLSQEQEQNFGKIYAALCKGEELEVEGLESQDKDGNAYFEDKKLVPIAIHGEEPEYFASISQVKV